ncbi:MAG: hypothetical protein R6U89_11990 [Dehalococcoidia bacterium]
MRRRFIETIVTVLTLVLVVSGVVTGMALAQNNDTTDQNELAKARQAGKSFIDKFSAVNPEVSEWERVTLTSPQVFSDLNGKVNAYLFALEHQNEVVGHVIVRRSSYGYIVSKAGKAAPSSIPTSYEAKSILDEQLGTKLDERNVEKPADLVYLGVDRLYAIYEIEGKRAVIDLTTRQCVDESALKKYSPLPSRDNVRQALDNISPLRSLPTLSYLPMLYWCGSGEDMCWCGPSSGVSIMRYYREYCGYSAFPSSDTTMYLELMDDMDTYTSGSWEGVTWPWEYDDGIRIFGDRYGYDFNTRVYYPSEIGYPSGSGIGLMITFYMNVCQDLYYDHIPYALCHVGSDPVNPGETERHWRAIKGYYHPSGTGDDMYFIFTDSREHDDWQVVWWFDFTGSKWATPVEGD